MMLFALLAVCLAHGLWVARGLGMYTAILDTYRDSGFIQGFLDGNLAGDPSIDGAKRYYPPLMHAIAAAVAWITHTRPLQLLIWAAPWVNLLIPVTFFLMVRSIFSAAVAALSTLVLVCFDGLLLPPWMAASYSPWHSVPAITQSLFFCGVWLINARTRPGRFRDAVGIGSIMGIVFLAHTVPALILAAIATAAAVSTQGLRVRTAVWIGVVAATAALWALPFMMPLITTYHLKILNAAGAIIDPLFDPTRIPTRLLGATLPGIGALTLLAASLARGRLPGPTVPALTIAILGVWILVPALFIARHFGCGVGGTAAVCTAFQVPVHHWMFYLQSALACMFGYAVIAVFAARTGTDVSRTDLIVAGSALALALALLVFRPMDQQMRQRAMDMQTRIDVALYDWLLAQTQPSAMFVTDISTNAVHDSAAMAVLAAGRKSVALPFTFSNPYIDWQTRKQRGDLYLAAAHSGHDQDALCRLLAEAGNGNAAYVALAPGSDAAADQLQLVFQSTANSVYAVKKSVCGRLTS
jgi:hypothetical protein